MCQKTIHTHSYHDNFWCNLRIERNISLKVIAEKLGMKTGSVGNYFIGLTMPKDDVIEQICEIFDVPFAQGKVEFYKGCVAYKATYKQGECSSNSQPNPEYSEDTLNHKVVKKHNKKAVALEDKTAHKVKHYTAWRNRLNESGVSATELATYLGKEKSTVIKYISGKSRPPKEITQLIADYFHVPYVQAAEEFQIAYEQYHNIEHKKPKKLADIDAESSVEIPEVVVSPAKVTRKKISAKKSDMLMKSLYGKVDAETFLAISTKGKISESKLRELYLTLDYDTFMELSSFLKR